MKITFNSKTTGYKVEGGGELRPIKGYLVSCKRIPAGRYCSTIQEATKEMNRQMACGSIESGISEVY